METFENDWTRIHDAMAANIKAKQELIEKLIDENIYLEEQCKRILKQLQVEGRG